jgi:TPR repeat protein
VLLRRTRMLCGTGLMLVACLAVPPGCAQDPAASTAPVPQDHTAGTAPDMPAQDAAAGPLPELRRLADAGDAEAAFKVGLTYDLGQGAPQDFVEAMDWYKRAAAQGHATAMFNVGVLYDAGRGVAEDHAEAARWYRRAAQLGFARADYNLGMMYQRGDGVPRDAAQARRYFEAAQRHGAEAARGKLAALAEAEDANGEFAFAQAEAQILERGLSGLDGDAVAKLRFAARKGNPLAQYDLGYCYEHGIGLPPAHVDAFVWYSRSANAPVSGPNAAASATRAAAVTAASAVQAQMTPDEQQKAAALLQQAASPVPR